MRKKHAFSFLMAAILAVVSTSYFLASEAAASVSGKVIAIDAGHGGSDPGAVANGIYEKDLVLKVAAHTKDRLEEAGATVIMTRTGDVYVGLEARAELANARNADTFVSIHANAATPSAHGTETFHFPSSSQGQALASALQTELVNTLNTRNRGVKSANFSVLRNTAMPAALVELGFITNAEEAERMKAASFPNEAATAIVRGLQQYH
ncbi:N-acetylmuramoyl-L-alanine amidase family protein [Shouchella clausii]|uniref:N-acetylmuramoyl-L-alanine amidase family protein n=1 Tax=Shouchella clausii TaxID=79880 RepID=UPI0015E7BB95|nr:N-acetylmuramoyl-L-alanine amidase [Shouchella clausii]